MEGLNRVILCGALGADPELKFTPGGQAVLRIRMATTETWWDEKAKERKERTEWHTVTVWGKRGEALAKILAKGRTVWVEGRLQTRSWEKDGEKRYATDVVANQVGLVGSGGGQRGDSGPRGGGGQSEGAPDSGGLDDGDALPF